MNKYCILPILTILALSSIAYGQYGEVYEVRTMQEYTAAKIDTRVDFLYFTRAGCSWCVKQEPIIRSLAKAFPQVRFVKLNGSQFGSIHRVNLYPTIVYKENRYIGYQEEWTLRRYLQQN